jgi:hypothetical protein
VLATHVRLLGSHGHRLFIIENESRGSNMSFIKRLAGSRTREASRRVEKIRMLKHLSTLEEAKIATQVSTMPEPLKRIHKRVRKTGISIEELELILDDLADKGAILITEKGGKKYYSNAMLPLGMFELQVKPLNEDIVKYVLSLFE